MVVAVAVVVEVASRPDCIWWCPTTAYSNIIFAMIDRPPPSLLGLSPVGDTNYLLTQLVDYNCPLYCWHHSPSGRLCRRPGRVSWPGRLLGGWARPGFRHNPRRHRSTWFVLGEYRELTGYDGRLQSFNIRDLRKKKLEFKINSNNYVLLYMDYQG